MLHYFLILFFTSSLLSMVGDVQQFVQLRRLSGSRLKIMPVRRLSEDSPLKSDLARASGFQENVCMLLSEGLFAADSVSHREKVSLERVSELEQLFIRQFEDPEEEHLCRLAIAAALLKGDVALFSRKDKKSFLTEIARCSSDLPWVRALLLFAYQPLENSECGVRLVSACDQKARKNAAVKLAITQQNKQWQHMRQEAALDAHEKVD